MPIVLFRNSPINQRDCKRYRSEQSPKNDAVPPIAKKSFVPWINHILMRAGMSSTGSIIFYPLFSRSCPSYFSRSALPTFSFISFYHVRINRREYHPIAKATHDFIIPRKAKNVNTWR